MNYDDDVWTGSTVPADVPGTECRPEAYSLAEYYCHYCYSCCNDDDVWTGGTVPADVPGAECRPEAHGPAVGATGPGAWCGRLCVITADTTHRGQWACTVLPLHAATVADSCLR